MHRSILLFLAFSALSAVAFAQEAVNVAQPYSSLIPDSFLDGNVVFAIDTPTVSYKPFTDKSPAFANSGTIPIFMYARLTADPAAEITMVTDTGGIIVDTVEIKRGSPVTFNLTLTSTLKPTSAALTFPTRVNVFLLTKIQGFYVPFQTDTLKFNSTFPPLGSSSITYESSANSLLSIYPNPASRQMSFKVSVPFAEYIALELYDLLGNQKAIIAAREYVSDERDFNFDASQLPSGSYFAKLACGGQVIIREIFIEK